VRGRKEEKDSMLTDQQIEIDYELERKILLEKNVLINEVEQSTQRINEIMNDMGIMVDEQGEQLDVISEELMKTNQNMVATNDNLEDAQTLQKKARKKYTCLIALILILLLIAGGILFFLLT
jgi:syntaxin 7